MGVKDYIRVPLADVEPLHLAKQILVLDLMIRPKPTLLVPNPNASSLRPIVRALRAKTRSDRRYVQLLRKDAMLLMTEVENASIFGRLPSSVVQFAVACRTAMPHRGRPRLTPAQRALWIKLANGDDRQRRRYKRQARIDAWIQAITDSGQTLLTVGD